MSITAVVFGLFLLLSFIKVSTFTITSDGHVEDFHLYDEKQEFRIRWKHSVEKEEWEEMFELSEGSISLTGTRFKTFGAGVPSDTGDETYIKDGWVYMMGIDQNIGKILRIRTGKDTDHRVYYGKDSILPLEEKQAYQLSVRQQSMLSAIRDYIFVETRGEHR